MTDYQKMWEEFGMWLMKMVDDTDMHPTQIYTYEGCLNKFFEVYAQHITYTEPEFHKKLREAKKRLEI